MHWLLMRPAVGWGTFLLVHTIAIPLIYGMGKKCGMKKASHSDAYNPVPFFETKLPDREY